ncbi:hypothetical protein A3Q56_02999 [Intoshia linei]|uniref:Amino acid permease/ SLC12A domain-containing protein n=1 Tax=Intoshia linei TaxID=1819745 RepID=A0A177B4Q2_9BILA|nr:hypothetical protein A3Q56_02999 [Intoshia linei]
MDCYISSESFKKCAAILALSCIMFVNNISVKYAINLQNIFTFSKVAALLAIIISGIYAMTTIGTSNLKNPFINSNYNILSISDAMYSGIFSFAGWNYLNLVTGEMINPKRDAPKSIILSTILVIVIYLLVIISYHTTLSIKEISNSITVAIDHAYTLSYAFAYFIPFAISLSTFGGLNGVFFTSVRLFIEGAKCGYLPKMLAMKHMKRHTPIISNLFLVYENNYVFNYYLVDNFDYYGIIWKPFKYDYYVLLFVLDICGNFDCSLNCIQKKEKSQYFKDTNKHTYLFYIHSIFYDSPSNYQ